MDCLLKRYRRMRYIGGTFDLVPFHGFITCLVVRTVLPQLHEDKNAHPRNDYIGENNIYRLSLY